MRQRAKQLQASKRSISWTQPAHQCDSLLIERPCGVDARASMGKQLAQKGEELDPHCMQRRESTAMLAQGHTNNEELSQNTHVYR